MSTRKWKSDELIKAFESLGATDAESWARSQMNEGIPQLHRFAFLKALWQKVNEADEAWLKMVVDGENDLPDEAAGEALQRMAALGVSDDDVVRVVRAARAELIYFLTNQLDDPAGALAELGYDGDEADILWGLFTVDEDGNPGKPIDGLHESVNEVGGRDD